jgi:hypothetical protein
LAPEEDAAGLEPAGEAGAEPPPHPASVPAMTTTAAAAGTVTRLQFGMLATLPLA